MIERRDEAGELDGAYRLDALDERVFVEKMTRVSASTTWVRELARRRPFGTARRLLDEAAEIWWKVCTRADWIEAFNGRPLIGDMESFVKDRWCEVEDALALAAPPPVAERLMACNAPYVERFGYRWILMCEGLTPEQQLQNYLRRIENDTETELHENSVEELKVTLRRLRLCLLGQDPYDRPEAMAGSKAASIGVAVIGAGVIGETFCAAFTDHGGYTIKVVCDLDADRARRLAARYQAEATTSFDEAIAREGVSLVYVGVPPRHHAAMVTAALRADKHVLCEKPLCLDDDQASAMARAAREAKGRGIVSAINYPLRYVEALHTFRRLLGEGYAGEVRRAALKVWFPAWPRAWQPYRKTDWINQRDQGGPLREIGSHFVFATLFLLGAVARINARVTYPPGDPSAAEIGAIGQLELASGIPMSLDVLSDVPTVEEVIELAVYGTEGVIALRDFQTLLVSRGGGPLAPYDRGAGSAEKRLMSSAPVVEALARAIRRDARAPDAADLVSIDEGARVQRVVGALYDSRGRWIEID